jgi:amino acid transporter
LTAEHSFSRRLNFIETVAISLAILSPTATAAITPSLTAAEAGAAGPLAFLLAGITAALIAFSFAQFARRFAHAGSISAYNSAAIGPRYGFVSGWTLAGVYTAFAAAIWGQFGDYFSVFWASLTGSSAGPYWIWPALVGAAAAWLLAHRSLQMSTRLLLVIEGLSLALIIAVAFLILARGGAHGINVSPIDTHGVPMSAIGLGMVFAFLSYAGFEGAATLGEESRDPHRAIPRALLGCVAVVAVLFVFMSWVETVGFGTSGIKELANSPAPLADLARRFADPAVATLIYLGATASAFGAALACVNAAARIVFSLSRQSLLPSALNRVHPRFSSPYRAVAVIMVVSVVTAVVLAPFASGVEVFGYLGTLGSLWIMVAYLLTVVASVIYFSRRRLWRPPVLVIPVVACVVLGYVLYSNVVPFPASPYNIIVCVAAGYLLLGAALIPVLRRRLVSGADPGEPASTVRAAASLLVTGEAAQLEGQPELHPRVLGRELPAGQLLDPPDPVAQRVPVHAKVGRRPLPVLTVPQQRLKRADQLTAPLAVVPFQRTEHRIGVHAKRAGVQPAQQDLVGVQMLEPRVLPAVATGDLRGEPRLPKGSRDLPDGGRRTDADP